MGLFRNIKLRFAANKQIKNLTYKQKQDFVIKWQQEHSAKKTNLPYEKWLRQHIAAKLKK